MRVSYRRSARTETGYALMMTMLFIVIAVILLSNILVSSATHASITARNNYYNNCISAAEAGTEMVLSYMDRDFLYQNVNPDLNAYRGLSPDHLQANWPMEYEFSDGNGNADKTSVELLGSGVSTNLNSQFQGLFGYASTYRITSQARLLNERYQPAAAVAQEVQFAAIPIFQFAIFYTIDLEINPGPVMRITGKTHSNADIYAAPQSGLTFEDSVTAVGHIYLNRNVNDPTGGPKVTPVFHGPEVEGVGALTLPVGPDNSPDSIHAILEPPPLGENPNSNLSKERFYNKADLIIKTTDTGVQVLTGAWNGFAPIQPDTGSGGNASYSFIKTDVSFNDPRESKWSVTTEVDVASFTNWIATSTNAAPINAALKTATGHGLNSIYVNDQRTKPGKFTSVRVVNGRYLPKDGLTVATSLPIYVKGNYNAPTLGSANTANTKPAALIGDAITVMSDNWNDNNAGKSLNQRTTVDTTVNAAFLGGIVQSTKVGNTKYYSGGVENFPRFVEDWSGHTFTYNGSMVVMFGSKYATKFWIAPGTYYNAPNRNWAFDTNFLIPSKLPPMTPQFRKLVRGSWKVVAAK